MWESLIKHISINAESIIFGPLTIKFWLISALLLFIILVQNIIFIRKTLLKSILFISQIIQSIIKTSSSTTKNVKKSRIFKKIVNEIVSLPLERVILKKNKAYFLLFVCAVLVALLYLSVPDIVTRNFEMNLKITLSVIFLFFFMIVYGLIFIFFPKYKDSASIFLIFGIMIVFMTKVSNIILSSGIAIIGIVLVLFLEKYRPITSSESQLWVLGTICVMLFVLFAGTAMADTFYGISNAEGKLELKLNINGDTNNRYVEDAIGLTCAGKNEVIFQETKNKCSLIHPFNISNGKIVFTHFRNASTIQNFTDLTFIAPKEVLGVFIELNGTLDDGSQISVTTGHKSGRFFFPSYEEYIERQKQFFSAISVIFGIILFSIPASMYYLKELSSKKRK